MSASDRAYRNARRFRRAMSPPEVLLWRRFRSADVRIRRQHPIGEFILDFYCPAAKLAIEVDGQSHDLGDRPERDTVRTAWLNSKGISVLRIAAQDVLSDPDTTANALLQLCCPKAEPLHHSASPSGPPPHAHGVGRSE